MKKYFAALFLVILFCLFSIFITSTQRTKTVLQTITPTKLIVDLNNNKSPDSNETICIANIESFSIAPDEEFVKHYSKALNLTKENIISLGYLAEDFAQKTLEDRDISIKFTGVQNSECRFANIKVNNINYKDLLAQSGFGIINGNVIEKEKYKQNLNTARKLNLVILNHHSNKYHTLTCPYGNVAHDKIIIPKSQLPKNAKPCKFCHKQHKHSKHKKKYHKKNYINYYDDIPQIPKPPLTITSGAIKSYYTDFTIQLTPNNQCTTKACIDLVNLINNTNESIDLALYGYTNTPAITKALQQAKQRGIKIRYVYDESFNPQNSYYKDNQIITQLAETSRSDRTETSTQSNILMHNKFVIFDKSIIYTGSMNFSNTGFSGYDVNNIIVIHSKDIANLYTKEFEQMLSGRFHTRKAKLNLPNKFILGNSQVEVYFSPKDKSSYRICELIRNAKHYIYMPTFLITNTQITNELINAHKRGVDVRLIIDANSTNTRNTKHKILRQNGILLKTENFAGKLHAKSIIIDDEYIISGSMNFSNSGENKNDENLLIIKDKAIAKSYKNFFLYLWTKIPNKYLKYNAKAESKSSIGSCSDGVDNNFNGKIDKEEALCK